MSQAKNFVSLKDETIRIFDNPFLDWCSRIHWVTPLVFWIPIFIFCLYSALIHFDFGALNTFLYFMIGVIIWTITEYLMHRFVFHYHPTSERGKRFFFLIHGVHHDYPNDSKRLVMPPLMSGILSIPFFAAFYYGFGGEGATYAAFSGIIIGYLLYDMLHYALHHAKWQNPIFEKLKKHHISHHFVHPDAGYGVSSTLWDIIFDTTLEKAKKKAE